MHGCRAGKVKIPLVVPSGYKLFFFSSQHKDFSAIKTGAEETLASHLVVFAAEKARKENRVITINDDMSFT